MRRVSEAASGVPAAVTIAPASAGASEKTLLVLEAVLTHDRFTDVVAATGLAKATVHRILSTLADRGFVTVSDGAYLPGPKILSLAGAVLQRIDISTIAQPFVDELVAKVHCTVHVGVANGDEIIYLIRSDSDKPYRMPSRVGNAIPMHCTGIGKAVLADYGDRELDRFVERSGLPRRTARTITDPETFRAEIHHVREVGYSRDREENVPGIACVAAPIRDHTGRVSYGVSISTITVEHSPEQIDAMAPDAMAAADQISRALGWTP